MSYTWGKPIMSNEELENLMRLFRQQDCKSGEASKMTGNMKSHELAHKLIATAIFLLSQPEFDTPSKTHSLYLGSYWNDKDSLIAMVKAVGTVTKEYDDSDLQINVHTPIKIWTRINRDKVCRKVQEAKWECDPLLTPEEVEAL